MRLNMTAGWLGKSFKYGAELILKPGLTLKE